MPIELGASRTASTRSRRRVPDDIRLGILGLGSMADTTCATPAAGELVALADPEAATRNRRPTTNPRRRQRPVVDAAVIAAPPPPRSRSPGRGRVPHPRRKAPRHGVEAGRHPHFAFARAGPRGAVGVGTRGAHRACVGGSLKGSSATSADRDAPPVALPRAHQRRRRGEGPSHARRGPGPRGWPVLPPARASARTSARRPHEDMMVASGRAAGGITVSPPRQLADPLQGPYDHRDGARRARRHYRHGDLTLRERPRAAVGRHRSLPRGQRGARLMRYALTKRPRPPRALPRRDSRRGQQSMSPWTGPGRKPARRRGHRLPRPPPFRIDLRTFGRSSSTARPLFHASHCSARGRPRPCSDERVHVREDTS